MVRVSDIKLLSDEDFYRDIQDSATRIKDNKLPSEVSWVHLVNSRDIYIRCASLCVILYRNLELSVVLDDVQKKEVYKYIQILNNDLKDAAGQELWMRWFTSINMAFAHFCALEANYEKALEYYKAVTDNVHNLNLWASMTTSHVSAALFRGVIYRRLGDDDAALSAFAEADGIFVKGINLLNLKDYWPAMELVGAVGYFCEIRNEEVITLGNPPYHERGKYLWSPFSDLLKIVASDPVSE